jgi:putative ABC transport system substrate-binding protein
MRVVAGLTVLAFAFGTTALAQAPKRVAITMVVETPNLLDAKQGVILGLAEKGFVEGKNLLIEYQNANGSSATQQQIARKMVGDNPDVIVPMTTPAGQAVVQSTKTIPVVFTVIVDPIKARMIPKWEQPGGNVTGVSDAPPLEEQLALFTEIVPGLKKLGFIYNPGLDSSQSILESIRPLAAAKGIEIVESGAPTSNEVVPAARRLVGKVDAIYIPNDTTTQTATETIAKVGYDAKLPVFAHEPRGVERGALAAAGINYLELGKIGGRMVAEVLNGKNPGTIDAVVAYKVNRKLDIVVNRGAAAKMGVQVPESVIKKAARVID